MSYYTIQAIVIALLVIIGIHYLITKVLFNEKKYKNKMKKKVVFQLPNEEQESVKEEQISQDEQSSSSGDLSSMKNDIMEFMDTNEIYQRDSSQTKIEPSDNQDDYSSSQFGNQQTNLDQFFKNKELDRDSQPDLQKKDIPSIEPKIDLSTKKRMDIDPEKVEQDNLMKPDLWRYENESIMNGGSLGGGLTAFDGCDSSLAVY